METAEKRAVPWSRISRRLVSNPVCFAKEAVKGSNQKLSFLGKSGDKRRGSKPTYREFLYQILKTRNFV